MITTMTTALEISVPNTTQEHVWEIVDYALAHFDAHRQTFQQREELEHSDGCACFYCFESFPASAITAWVDNNNTAICPHCGMDSVIGSASGFPLAKVFLRRMYARAY